MTKTRAHSTWKLQRSRRPKGFYYQAVYGKGRDRRAFTLGYLSEEEALLAESNMGDLCHPDAVVVTAWDREGLEPPPPTRATVTAGVKAFLLDTTPADFEVAMAEWAGAEATRLEAQGRYGDLSLKDFVERVYGPVRWTQHPDSEEKERWTWGRIVRHLGSVKVKNLDLHRWTRFLMTQSTWCPRSKQIAQNTYRGALKYAAEIGAIEAVHANGDD